MSSLITGTGSYIPEVVMRNEDFENHHFFTREGERIEQDGAEVVQKFQQITGIRERRYARPEEQTSDLATRAAREALKDANTDPEELDGIILAHNFGNIPHGRVQSDILPSLATRAKYNLGIGNPDCIAFDVLYGCPGWIQALILADQYLQLGKGRKYLVIGAETLSRKLDPHDRDSMIFADGAGACVLEEVDGAEHKGILSSVSQTFTQQEAYYLYYDTSCNPDDTSGTQFLKMLGHRVFEFALTHVPAAMKKCMDQSGVPIADVKKVLIHQANEKLDEGIIKRFYRQYKMQPPAGIMPMSIHLLGNSSVATVPTLLDLLRKGKLKDHSLEEGDVILLASVGAGMSINAITYRV